MKPVMQTVVGPDGDCLPACIASILELPLAEVPHFSRVHGDKWPEGLAAFMLRRRLAPILLEWGDAVAGWVRESGVLCVITGETFHDTLHSVVARGNVVVHDPAPTRVGFKRFPIDVMLFVAVDPARMPEPPEEPANIGPFFDRT